MTPEKKVEPAPLVPPFVRYVASAIPMVFDDSLSYYECLAALTKYLQDVVKVINNNGAVTEEYIQLTKDMKEYMDNYFENLDVQEEINNKLDAMVEAGTLQEIIAEYIQANVAWTFDTVAEMKSSTNLIAGSYAQTLGFYSANDGGESLYYITDTGIANEMDVIAIGDLYAVLVNGKNVKQYGAYGDGTHDDSAVIQYVVNTITDVYIPDGTYMINPVLDNVNKVGIKLTNNSKLTLSQNAELKAIASSETNYAVIATYGASNVEICGGKVTGDRTVHTGDTGEWGHCITVTNSSDNVKIKNIIISDAWGDGVYINGVTNVQTEGLTIDNCRRNGISVIAVENYYSLNDVITDSNGTKPENGLDIEPNHTSDPLKNVIVENLTTKGCAGAGLNIHLLNLDGTYPVDIKIFNHYDDGSLNGLALAKPAASKGLVEIIKPYYANSQLQGIALRRCYNSDCKVIIDSPMVINADTTGDTTSAGGSAISAYLISSDSHTAIGNIVIKEPYTTNASAVSSCINISSFSDTAITNVSILNPLNSDSKYIFIDGGTPTVLFTDLYEQFTLTHTANLNLSVARYYSKYTNEGATGNIAVTLPTGINVGRKLTFQNLSSGHRYRIFMPSGQYLKQILSDTAGGNFYIDNLGDKITLKKISSTEWIVEELNCTPALS